MRISFVVVTWNASQMIEQCITSIVRCAGVSRCEHAEVIVLDNGSSDADETARIVTNLGTRFIGLDRNFGLATAWNLGVEAAKGDILIFVNPDAMLGSGCVEVMVRAIVLGKPPFVVGPKTYFPTTNQIQHAGGEIQLPRCVTKHRGYGEADRGQFDNRKPVDYVTGAVFGCSRATIELLDGFDTRFFPAYYEDVDFCWRAWGTGGTVQFLPKAVAYHAEGSSLGVDSLEFFEAYNRNRLRFLTKHLSDLVLVSEYVQEETRWLEDLEESRYRVALELFSTFASEASVLSHDGPPYKLRSAWVQIVTLASAARG